MAELKAAEAVGNVDESEVQKRIERRLPPSRQRLGQWWKSWIQKRQHALQQRIEREDSAKASLEAASKLHSKVKKKIWTHNFSGKISFDRKLRQLEQCLSMAEERADRAEAEAHDANVESQLAGTLVSRYV